MGVDQTSKSPIITLHIRDSAYLPYGDWWYSSSQKNKKKEKSSHQHHPLIIICPSIYSALLSITPRPSHACFTAISFVFVIVVINVIAVIIVIIATGWQKLRGSTGGTRRKVWTRTKILSPSIRYFVAIYALFLEIFGHKKCLFG